MSQLELRDIRKTYPGALDETLKGINIDIASGEFLTLVGPSGCGKSTLMNSIAGLESITGGSIVVEGKDISTMEPKDRDIAMVFQSYALYPTMSVRENIAFGLKIRGMPKDEIQQEVERVADLLQISALLDKKPARLSGGQQQRVAMGRALARRPKIYLFDEPLSNLDAELRVQTRLEIAGLHKSLASTMIYVTHDQVEAMTLADRIVIMRDGHIEQIGTPLDVFENPVNTFVATFIGSPPMNLLDGVVKEGQIEFADGTCLAVPPAYSTYDGQAVTFGVRADNIMPVGHALPRGEHMAEVEMTVDLTEPLGTETLLFTVLAGTEVQAKMLNPRPVRSGERMTFQIMLDKCHLFDADTGATLKK